MHRVGALLPRMRLWTLVGALLFAGVASLAIGASEARAWYTCHFANSACGFGGLTPGAYVVGPVWGDSTYSPFMHNNNTGTSKRIDVHYCPTGPGSCGLINQHSGSTRIFTVPASAGAGTSRRYVCVNVWTGNVGVNCGEHH